jgi:midasin (ATPase involved in ribosome maturation)
MGFTKNQLAFIVAAKRFVAENPSAGSRFDRADLTQIAGENGLSFPQWLTTNTAYRVDRGVYTIPGLDGPVPVVAPKKVAAKKAVTITAKAAAAVANVTGAVEDSVAPVAGPVTLAKGVTEFSHIPEVDGGFVPFGYFKVVFNVIKSRKFYPIFVTGLSGNGKTLMVEQAAAKAKRDLLRVNITVETDEDDLLGGFRLVDGETVWFDGPVVKAMKMGAILLLDEVDLASTKIMCLQPVLEGKGIFLKKINEWVVPADGFTVIATANTKGKGDSTGNFIGAGVMNEAFLERFPITVEQDYPSMAVEKKILGKVFVDNGVEDNDFIDNLVSWADTIRKSYKEDAIDEIITTRRLVHISEAFAIFGDRMESINLCISRFDDETKASFLELYTKVDADIDPNVEVSVGDDAEGVEVDPESNDCPF